MTKATLNTFVITTAMLALCSINFTFAEEINNNVHAQHVMQNNKQIKQQPTIKMNVQKTEQQGNQESVEIELLQAQHDNPLTLDLLKEIHTKKIHFLIIDGSLTDYHHIHPTPTKKNGVYTFNWQPKTNNDYRIWADLFPLQTNAQEYITADLVTTANAKPAIDRNLSEKNKIDDFTFTLSFDTPKLTVGKAAIGKILITDSKGKPVKNLEPIMGAFAHIVGFNEDFKTVTHIHPMGREPKNASDRGGSELEFHIEPEKSGYTKLFAQVLINGKELFVPFGIMVY